jgi:O-antigen/teichoic acid export membrane protein
MDQYARSTRSRWRNIAQVFSFDVCAKAVLAVSTLLLIRYMSKAEFAKYTFSYALVTGFTQFFASSFNQIYIVSHRRLNLAQSYSMYLGFQLLLLTGAAVPLFFLVGADRFLGFSAVAMLLGNCLLEFTRTTLQQELKFLRFSIVECSRAVFLLAAIVCLVGAGDITTKYVLLSQAAIGMLLFLTMTSRRVAFRQPDYLRNTARLARELFLSRDRYAFGYFALLGLFGQLSVLLLKAYGTAPQLAAFGSAFRYYSLLLLALSAVNYVFLPVTQTLKSWEEIDALFAQHKAACLMFCPIVLAAAWAFGWVMPWIDQGKYPEALAIFRVLAVSSALSFWFSPHANVLIRFDGFRFLLVLVATAIVFNTVAGVVLIPRFGPVSAAILLLLSTAVINCGAFLRVRVIRRQRPLDLATSALAVESESL